MPKANLIAAFLICAFVIDRLVSAIFFVASYGNAAQRAENNRKLIRFLVSGLFAAAAIFAFDFLRILNTVLPSQPLLDAAVTWLVLVAGAERLSSFIGDRASAAPAETRPADQKLRVAGTLQLDDSSEKILRMQHS